MCGLICLSDVALKLLKRYENLPKESLSVYNFSVPKLLRESLSLNDKILELDSSQQPLYTDKFSALVALAKIPSAFPSGNQFSHREQFIYDILSVENKIRDNYGIHDIAYIVRKATHFTLDDDQRLLKTSSVVRIGFGRHVLNFSLLVMRYGWRFCKLLVSMPVKLLGLILHGIAYLFIQSFKFLNIFGVRRIYDMKYTHYEVIGILSYFCQSIVEFNDSQLKVASANESMLHGAQHGIVEFINAMRKASPELLSVVDSCNRGIFSHAVLRRKQNVFQLMHCLDGRKKKFTSGIDTLNLE
ncbi:ankyrin repeat-containing protein ITN1 [Trifolium repens]|nr:ankyrin repeat-containing protein ITN1 [Trifolium repens]